MKRVVLESPYAGDIVRNTRYAMACMRDCLRRGESPIASHLLWTQPGLLRDDVPEERLRGREAGLAWHVVADAIVFYEDLGWSVGMELAREHAHGLGLPDIEIRSLGPAWDSPQWDGHHAYHDGYLFVIHGYAGAWGWTLFPPGRAHSETLRPEALYPSEFEAKRAIEDAWRTHRAR